MKCHTATCSSEPVNTVYWPGEGPPPKMCAPCTVRAVLIGATLGMRVHHEPLPPAAETEAAS